MQTLNDFYRQFFSENVTTLQNPAGGQVVVFGRTSVDWPGEIDIIGRDADGNETIIGTIGTTHPASVFLEVKMRQTTGTAYADLFNVTRSQVVSNSLISSTSGTFELVRSPALNLIGAPNVLGDEFEIRLGKFAGDAGEALMGTVLAI